MLLLTTAFPCFYTSFVAAFADPVAVVSVVAVVAVVAVVVVVVVVVCCC